MYEIDEVAALVINYSIDIGHPVSNLKLQKLLYFIQKDFLKRDLSKPCFEEDLVHWKHGPVSEYIYRKYRIFLADPITRRVAKVFKFVWEDFEYRLVNFTEKSFTEDDLLHIKKIVDIYRDMGAWEMVDLTHRELSWIQTDENEIICKELIASS